MRQLGEKIAIFFAKFYHTYGFDIEVPYPRGVNKQMLTDAYIKMRLSVSQALFFRASSQEAPFTALADRLSGSSFWTTSNHDILIHAQPENTKNGYWFWADIGWNKNKMKRRHEITDQNIPNLLCLEEYLIFSYAANLSNPLISDELRTLKINSWLRTRVHGKLLSARDEGVISIDDERPGYLRYFEPLIR